MSKGTVHTLASVSLAGAFTAGTLMTGNPDDLQYVVGALTGILITPDCDVDAKFIAYKYIRQRLGKAAEFGWNMLWYYYRKSLKHGSELSHMPVISTLGRIAYLFLFAIVFPNLLLAALGYDAWSEIQWWFWQIMTHWKVVVGLMSADFIHWGLDILTTEHSKGKHGFHMGMSFLRRSVPASPKTTRR